MEQKQLHDYTISELKDYANKHNISLKNTSRLRKQELFDFINEKVKQSETNIIDTFVKDMSIALESSTKNLLSYKVNFHSLPSVIDYVGNKTLNSNLIEKLLQCTHHPRYVLTKFCKLRIGDIVKISEDYDEGYFIKKDNETLISFNSCVIPIEISDLFNDPVYSFRCDRFYLHEIEINKDSPCVKEKFGEFDAPIEWIYCINLDYVLSIYTNNDDKDDGDALGYIDPSLNSSYLYDIRRNSIDELQKIYYINLEETKTFDINFDVYEDDFGKEESFVCIPDIPNYCYLYINTDYLDTGNITFQHKNKKVRRYEINLIYLIKHEKQMSEFVLKYYSTDKPNFIENVNIESIC